MTATLSPEQKARAIELGKKAQQMGWDFEALMRKPWQGPAPLHFTTEAFTVDELSAAWARYIEENGHFGCLIYSHMWAHPGWTGETGVAPEGHMFFETATDMRCTISGHRRYGERPCECVGGSLTRIQCDGCGFLHIGSREQGVVLWHDAHWPGWRDLPVAPDMASAGPEKAQNAAKKFALENYPAEWQVPGAPIITERERMSSRSVPGRSPWKGFDIATWNLRWDAHDVTQWHHEHQLAVLEAEEEHERVMETVRRYGK